MSENIPVHITDAQFEQEVLKADGIVLVDFWAPRCGPCVQMAPAIEAFTSKNAGKVRVFKLDVDDNPKAAEKYGIKSIPTLVFFKEGEVIDVSVGAASRTSLQTKLDALLRPDSPFPSTRSA
jgi:thioredoxin 1